MKKIGIVNIINFIRATEPRIPEIDLYEPVEKQMKCVSKYNFPATWLLQYDALINNRFIEIMKSCPKNHEIGIWFELVRPLVEEAGIKWRGRYDWDWHADVGFSVGYTPKERERIADVFMEKFRDIFGKYPESVGSWFIDAHLLGYLSDKYDINASCNCKDQWGTDGYTLWGGYYGQAYYPSMKNSFMPAQNEEKQIPVPIFRMLGVDPIYQYDATEEGNGQTVKTLEPAYENGGGCSEWVRWFFETTFKNPSLSFGYAQVGQENSFGWKRMEKGFTYQISLLAKISAQYNIRIETLSDTGKWFKSTYKTTPTSAITALTDWKQEGRKSIWFYSRYYRINLFLENESLKIRDIHVFDENYQERYLNLACESSTVIYDTLPVLDGSRWSGYEKTACIIPVILQPHGGHFTLKGSKFFLKEALDKRVHIIQSFPNGGTIEIKCMDICVEIFSSASHFGIFISWGTYTGPSILQKNNSIILQYNHNGYPYSVEIINVNMEIKPSHILLMPVDSSMPIQFMFV
ncbi:MAG: hypothetical protein M1135_02320 [Candidatus Omnitrophica bacterium]|nr:hypothetical protein [Candidatus Omnitrophota bacterium]